MAGAGPIRLMTRTILPNCLAPLIVQATLSFSNAILDAAALGFLGMGAQPPTPEWGTMLAEAREFILRAWWVVTFPGLAILITVLAINLDRRRPPRRARSEAQAELSVEAWIRVGGHRSRHILARHHCRLVMHAHGSERLLETARRQEKIQDFQTALSRTSAAPVIGFEQIDLDRHLEEMVAQIESAPEGRDYTPFVPREPGSLLWPSVSQEVHILPNEVIDPVVLFFSQLETVRHFVDDLRSDRFAALERARKIAMYQDYVRMMKYLVLLADDADARIEQIARDPAAGQ